MEQNAKQTGSGPMAGPTDRGLSKPPADPRIPLRHLNQRDVAQRWSISPRTLERWRWIGQGPRFLKVGGRVVYRLEDIEAYEAEQLRTSTLVPAHQSGGAK
jgi:hypothetical protein